MLLVKDLGVGNKRVWLDGNEISQHITAVEVTSNAGDVARAKITLGYLPIEIAIADPFVSYVRLCRNCGAEFDLDGLDDARLYCNRETCFTTGL